MHLVETCYYFVVALKKLNSKETSDYQLRMLKQVSEFPEKKIGQMHVSSSFNNRPCTLACARVHRDKVFQSRFLLFLIEISRAQCVIDIRIRYLYVTYTCMLEHFNMY